MRCVCPVAETINGVFLLQSLLQNEVFGDDGLSEGAETLGFQNKWWWGFFRNGEVSR